MGDVLYTDFKNKTGHYTRGPGGIDDMVGFTEPPLEDTAPSEMPFCAPESDPA
ncbi:hypothetical protein ABIF96_005775 [Bradyrhizobium ottawaense]|uniref:hypothetical protein n=1 Tax=Bradyrhizobium ottawaense TaxID=931866 RepID=UPI00383865C0